MEKTYTISYKTYLNERLKPVNFHGKEIYPLYVQVTFDRQTIYFKSYFFDHFSHPEYAIHSYLGSRIPEIKDIEAKEKALIDFILEKNREQFSLELFKEEYAYYGFDLLTPLEEGFKYYMWVFFNDEGLELFASMIQLIGKYNTGANIIDGIRRALKPDLYAKLLENAVYFTTSYLPLEAFAQKIEYQKDLLATFCRYEWELPGVKEALFEFIAKRFPTYPKEQVQEEIEKLLKRK